MTTTQDRWPQAATPKSDNLNLILPRGRKYDPFEHAETLGINVVERPIKRANEIWIPEWNLIAVRSSLRPAHKRVALAHGIGHAQLGHTDDLPPRERAADRFASLYLVHPGEFQEAAKWHGGDLRMIAVELGVTWTILKAFLDRQSASG